MDDEARGTSTPGQALTRRMLVKGAAWSVPVIAAVMALPMAAASGAPGQTPCTEEASATFGTASSPAAPPHATITSPIEPAYPLHKFKAGQRHEVTVTSTIAYTGSLPSYPTQRHTQYPLHQYVL